MGGLSAQTSLQFVDGKLYMLYEQADSLVVSSYPSCPGPPVTGRAGRFCGKAGQDNKTLYPKKTLIDPGLSACRSGRARTAARRIRRRHVQLCEHSIETNRPRSPKSP